jgi:PQQ-like domain
VWVWTAATVALVVVAVLLWRGSDAAATDSTTAEPSAGVPSGTPAVEVSEAWAVDGADQPETVVQGGRVLVAVDHGVRAVDPLTGEAWHYTRSNARVCGLTVTDGLAIAVFATEDRCDEAVALRAGTGVRAWTRTLSLQGDARLDSASGIVLAHNATGLVTLDPTGNNIRWRYAPPAGCRLLDAEVGSAGVAALLQCADTDTLQVRLLDGFQGDEHWTVAVPEPEDAADARLLGADRLLGVLVGDEALALAADDGAVRARLPVEGDVQMGTAGAVSLLRTGGTLSALDGDTGTLLWEAPAVGLPGAIVPDKDDDADPAGLLVPDAQGFTQRHPATGEELGRSAVTGVPDGGVATGVGPVVVYRLADRVLAYR